MAFRGFSFWTLHICTCFNNQTTSIIDCYQIVSRVNPQTLLMQNIQIDKMHTCNLKAWKLHKDFKDVGIFFQVAGQMDHKSFPQAFSLDTLASWNPIRFELIPSKLYPYKIQQSFSSWFTWGKTEVADLKLILEAQELTLIHLWRYEMTVWNDWTCSSTNQAFWPTSSLYTLSLMCTTSTPKQLFSEVNIFWFHSISVWCFPFIFVFSISSNKPNCNVSYLYLER